MTRHAIEVMGTVFSLDLRDPVTDDVLAAVEADLRWVDATFSTYRDDSAVSRLANGEARLDECPPEVAEVLDLCAEALRTTEGWFSATAGGRLDPTGLVKGWAVRRVDLILRAAGSARHAVNGGGDVWLGAPPEPGEPWHVGVTDPHTPGDVLAVVSGAELAVATSGVAERGRHVVDPFTARPAAGVAAVTVVGPDIVTADAYATAAVAMGAAAPRWLDELDGYAGLVVTDDGDVQTTTDWSWPVGRQSARKSSSSADSRSAAWTGTQWLTPSIRS